MTQIPQEELPHLKPYSHQLSHRDRTASFKLLWFPDLPALTDSLLFKAFLQNAGVHCDFDQCILWSDTSLSCWPTREAFSETISKVTKSLLLTILFLLAMAESTDLQSSCALKCIQSEKRQWCEILLPIDGSYSTILFCYKNIRVSVAVCTYAIVNELIYWRSHLDF